MSDATDETRAGTRESSLCALDVAVVAALEGLEREGLAAPRALFLMGTGGGLLPLRLKPAARGNLPRIADLPQAWQGAPIHAGELSGLPVWILEDAPGPPERGALPAAGEPAWVRSFPCWLAAAAGAAVLVHTSAGASLIDEIGPGSLAILSDHLNLSGRTPLLGLSGSQLGPLFPDLSLLHHAELRARALAICAELGVPARAAVAACTSGPALDTPAERRFFALAGGEVAVQNLEGPLLAAAHAGLAALAIVCVTDRGDGQADLSTILAAAERLAPALEDLLARLAPGIARAADDLEVEA
jgi:purine-nucleoside phosphorylase